MDAQHFREKADVLLRLADGLSSNNLGQFQMMELAEDLMKRARGFAAIALRKVPTITLEVSAQSRLALR